MINDEFGPGSTPEPIPPEEPAIHLDGTPYQAPSSDAPAGFSEPAHGDSNAAAPNPAPQNITDPYLKSQPVRPVQPYGVDESKSGWSEPVYEQFSGADPDAYTPGRYAYGAQNVQPPAEEPRGKKKKPRRSHGFLKAVCIVVICALVSGSASWLVVDYMLDHRPAESAGKQVVFGSTPVSSADLPETPAVSGTELTGNQIYTLAQKQVVGVNTSLTTNIFGQTTTQAVSGSGFIISEDGYILTNYHVISYAVVYGGELTVLMEDGVKYPAEIVGYVESNDVAVIKIDATGLSPVTLGDSDSMLVGEQVYAVGNPLGELEYTMTPGIVSAQDRVITTNDDITGAATSINMFQISAAVNHGNSGGPVYNSRGEVIGIVTAKYSDADEGIEGLGFAIPINDAVSIAKQLVETGHVASAGLGITGIDANVVFNEVAMERYSIPGGVYVDSVNSGSAAEKAGLLEGDIITALGGKEVAGMDELKMALRRCSPGQTESITVYRMGSKINVGEYVDLTITFEELIEEPTDTTQQQQQQSGGSYGYGWPWNGGWGW